MIIPENRSGEESEEATRLGLGEDTVSTTTVSPARRRLIRRSRTPRSPVTESDLVNDDDDVGQASSNDDDSGENIVDGNDDNDDEHNLDRPEESSLRVRTRKTPTTPTKRNNMKSRAIKKQQDNSFSFPGSRKRSSSNSTTTASSGEEAFSSGATPSTPQRRSTRKRQAIRRTSLVDLADMDDEQFDKYCTGDVRKKSLSRRSRGGSLNKNGNNESLSSSSSGEEDDAGEMKDRSTSSERKHGHNPKRRRVCRRASQNHSSDSETGEEDEEDPMVLPTCNVRMLFKSCRDDHYRIAEEGCFPTILNTHSFKDKYDLRFENVDESCLEAMNNFTMRSSLFIDLVHAKHLHQVLLPSGHNTHPSILERGSWKCSDPIGQPSIDSILILSIHRIKGGVLLVRFGINPLYDSHRFLNSQFRLRVVFRPGMEYTGFTLYSPSFCVCTPRSTVSKGWNRREMKEQERLTQEQDTSIDHQSVTRSKLYELHKPNGLHMLLSCMK